LIEEKLGSLRRHLCSQQLAIYPQKAKVSILLLI
jgi:hypothetical protein